jgi:hypothetical protein
MQATAQGFYASGPIDVKHGAPTIACAHLMQLAQWDHASVNVFHHEFGRRNAEVGAT